MNVSIITPIYNCSEYLAETIKSVISQTFHNWEMIIIDDCSTDDSLSIANNYAKIDNRIKIFSLKRNSGPAIARNTGIKLCSGRFISFLDGDDLWHETKLEKQIAFMLKNKIDFSYTAYDKINKLGDVFEFNGVSERIDYNNLLKTCEIGCLTAVYDTDKIGKIYMPVNTKREDFGTWLKILKQINYAYGIQENLAQYRVYEFQSSSKKIKMSIENWRLYRDIEKLSFLQTSYYFSHYAVRGLLRTRFPNLARFIGVLK